MATARFVEDPEFLDNLLHWRGSLNPIGDKVRSTADRCRDNARRLARQEVRAAKAEANALASRRYSKFGGEKYRRARAMAYSMQKYADLLFAAEIHQPDQNIAIVAAGHAAGAQIEFGGVDQVIMAGDVPLDYPATHILRRSIV